MPSRNGAGGLGRFPAVFMDEPAQPILAHDRVAGWWLSSQRWGVGRGSAGPQTLVRSGPPGSGGRRAASKCRRPKIRRWSSISWRVVPTQRSAKAFARGARTGSRTTLRPSLRKTSSKARVNFASRSRRRKRGRSWPSAISQDRFRACCPTHEATVSPPRVLLGQAAEKAGPRRPRPSPASSRQSAGCQRVGALDTQGTELMAKGEQLGERRRRDGGRGGPPGAGKSE